MPPKAPYLNGNRYWANIPGLGRRPLIPAGEKLATKNPAIAAKLFSEWVARIEAKQRGIALGIDQGKDILPGKYAIKYLDKRKEKRKEARGIRANEPLLKSDIAALDKTRQSIMLCLECPAVKKLKTLRAFDEEVAEEVIRYLKHDVKTRRGELLRPGAVRRILMELSGMLTSAVKGKYLSKNSLRGNEDIPKVKKKTALNKSAYLTRDEVRRELDCVRYSSRNPWAVEQATTLFYTGVRAGECQGLLVSDFDFDRKRIHIRGRTEDGHRVKSEDAERDVPFWPRLEAVMHASFELSPRNPDGLAFPVPGTEMLPLSQQRQMQRLRGTLKSAAKRAQISKPVGHHIARHSYISARQEMVERDMLGIEHPVPTAYIAREVGHADEKLIRDVYGHLPKSGVRQSILDYGERDPIPYMEAYRRKRARLAKRRARHEARQALRQLRRQP